MNMDELIKYIIWIVVFGLALLGIYKLLASLGVM
jgi:hypothetical protein